ncbi:hypothetical protein GCM10007879_15220 [Maritalea porphyrae]|uniref:Transcriptional regulator n=1 Tax=Maritalea porphyrae TaxID=880732 RepID=A0ABQ5URQ5_9HYPH|nr:hypothetical protein GCM10007879_15220 [Maritalea porphyrae]
MGKARPKKLTRNDISFGVSALIAKATPRSINPQSSAARVGCQVNRARAPLK